MFRIVCLFVCSAVLLVANGGEKRLNESAAVFREVMQISDRSIPQDLLDRAHCIAIIPGLKKIAFIGGGNYGRGFLSCRKADKVGWSAPAAIRIEGGSVGLQLGAAETDVIMLVLNERGMEKLLSSQFTLGGEGQVAAGPVGRRTSAETDAYLRAEILSWSRSRGAFAGISLQGSTLRQDLDTNEELYGKELQNKEIVTGGVAPPKPAGELMSLLNKYSSRK